MSGYYQSLVKLIEFFPRHIWLVLVFCLSLTLSGLNPIMSYSQPPTSEIRGVWLTNIDSDVLFSVGKTKTAIASLADLNFNTLYPTVWNWGYTLYPSQVAAKVTGVALDPTEGLQNRDVLQEIITIGHEQGMAVIPWFEFGFMAPLDSELAKRHPEWLTQRLDGSTIWLEGNVHQRVWLNPLHPEVQKFIADLVVEIVEGYDLDGIQFDDHFGLPSEFGYDSYTLRLYQQEHDGKLPPLNYKNEEWVRWRADKITDYMKDLFKAIKATKQQVLVSVSPNPQSFSLENYLLDWEKWERIGLIEELILQVYRDNMEAFERELNQPEIQAAKQHIPVGIGILSGLKGLSRDLKLITKQVNNTRQQGLAGVSFFFYESLWNFGPETKVERQLGFKSLFPDQLKREQLSRI
jgi:uncharacterized lipoprotein YddW (UPF0748 family)